MLQEVLRILNEGRDNSSSEKAAECSQSALYVQRSELECLLSNSPTISGTGLVDICSTWSNDLLGEGCEAHRRNIMGKIVFAERSPLLSPVESNNGSGSGFLLFSLPPKGAEKVNTD